MRQKKHERLDGEFLGYDFSPIRDAIRHMEFDQEESEQSRNYRMRKHEEAHRHLKTIRRPF